MKELRPGDALPPLVLPPLTRSVLALYAGGSGDHVPLHIDAAFARAAGYRDQVMQGMLGAAYIARMLTQTVRQEALTSLDVRFLALTYPDEALTVTGTVRDASEDGTQVRVAITLHGADQEVKARGSATLDLSRA